MESHGITRPPILQNYENPTGPIYESSNSNMLTRYFCDSDKSVGEQGLFQNCHVVICGKLPYLVRVLEANGVLRDLALCSVDLAKEPTSRLWAKSMPEYQHHMRCL